jgi:putative oxidoreductase
MHRIAELLEAAANLAERVGRTLHWAAPTLARLTVGLVFFDSGWGKLHDLEKVTDYFAQLGLPNPAFQARFASTAEFVCGGLLLLGLATRFAAVPLIIVMCVAIRTALWDQVSSLSTLVGLTEFAYIALLFWLATDGGGPLSLDRLIAGMWHREERGHPHRPMASTGSAREQVEKGERMMTKKKGMLVAAAAATLFLSGAVGARAEEKAGGETVMCSGINACKGQGACAGGGHGCAGKNGCKGQGLSKTTAAECTAKGGKVAQPEKK